MLDLTNPPLTHWHCYVKPIGDKGYSIVNDLSYEDLQRTIVQPWLNNQIFTISGAIVNPKDGVSKIQIAHTDAPMSYYAEQHNAAMRANGRRDFVTDRRMLPLAKGSDATFDLLFSGAHRRAPEPDTELVIRVCERLPQAARILENRPRQGKEPFRISDEYDVQDLLQATLRAYLKYSVQEDPLPKVGGAKSGRADVSIEELGIIIEVKYVRGPADQKRLFDEYSQDLILYAEWPHLRTLVYLVYNSDDLRDPEALEKLSVTQEIGGKRFDVRMVLA